MKLSTFVKRVLIREKLTVIESICHQNLYLCRSGEQVSNDVKIWSVKASALVFEVLYESARTASPPSSHTPSQPQVSDGLTISSPSDTYGTFPSIQTDLVI
jgi:hypothetical protein